ncbi:MAG TPA: MFS transporter [Rhizomicrobium sp.]|nr:MFS transporter [Rhizomicrobium sp.]
MATLETSVATDPKIPPGLKSPGARAWLVLGMLCFVYVLNFLDRQLLAILAKPIQDTLHITDGQLGLIGGLYFALFYCFIAIPVGWLADRTNRVRVLSLACALWSAATMACGVAATYPQLVGARMAVGIGEAGGVPPSYAIVTDYFPPGRRATALGIFNLGPPIGQALGVAFGASIAAAYSWRHAFVILGGVGVLTALLVILLVREPRRGQFDEQTKGMPTATAGFKETVAMFFSQRALVLAAVAAGTTQIITYGAGNFTTLFLIREKGMTLQQIAMYYSLIVLFGMGGGIGVSGRVIDYFTRRSKRSYAIIPAVALVFAVPPFIAFIGAPSWQLALLFLLGPAFFNYFYLSSVVALVQEEVAPQQRVLSGALLLLVMNFMGLGLGPTFVGAASDFFRASHYGHSLQLAFYALIPCYVVAIALFIWLARVLGRERSPIGVTR